MKPSLKVTPIPTSIFLKGQGLADFVIDHLKGKTLGHNPVVAITSKIVSLSENQTLSKNSIDKLELIKKEADYDLGDFPYGTRLTIKHNLLIPTAGIDESNSENDEYILFPKDPFQSAKNLQLKLKDFFKTDIGVIITDSHTLPLRYGVTGISLAYWGFHGIKSLINQPDIFGRPLKFTKMDIADGLAAAAVLTMGESNEQTPIALIENADIVFSDSIDPKELLVSPQEDLYFPLYSERMKKL